MQYDRRSVIIGGIGAALARPAFAAEAMPPPDTPQPQYAPNGGRATTYEKGEITAKVSDFFGVTTEAIGGVVERTFHDKGQPTGYIAGQEGSAAIAVGVRYGKGLLYMKDREPVSVYWQGPSLGWDLGGNASRVFTLCYNLQDPQMIYQRFPGVEGSAYFIGGFGVNYQKAETMTLAPIRTGVGLRLGANVGYLAYTRRRSIIPF